MSELLGSAAFIIVIGYIFFRFKTSGGRMAEVIELRQNDIEKATKQKNLEAELAQISKELAEKQSGLKNMTPEQVEDYWKKNS